MKITFIVALILMSLGCATKSEDKLPTQVVTEKKVETRVTPTADPFEWKGACRKVLNEGGKEITKSTKRLQSSYIFKNKIVIWDVNTYEDSKCEKLIAGNRYTFNCDSNPLQHDAKCNQNSWEVSDGQGWMSKAMVDSAGYANKLVMQYYLKILKAKTANLISRSISDEGEIETTLLTLQ